jgi:hypothetical protein
MLTEKNELNDLTLISQPIISPHNGHLYPLSHQQQIKYYYYRLFNFLYWIKSYYNNVMDNFF